KDLIDHDAEKKSRAAKLRKGLQAGLAATVITAAYLGGVAVLVWPAVDAAKLA
ncbi:MAG: hypothetical protein HKO53_10010, partial [Gemmatimonadetes bacterium]|nr:hypothetical protein [Gemmatimonadota bacterium]